MKNHVVVVLGLIAAMSVAGAAQSNLFQGEVAVHVAHAGVETEISRPLLVPSKPVDIELPSAANIALDERMLFDMVNQKRAENGLKSLSWSDDLETLAHRHSQDMADNKYFSHRGLDGSKVSDRADRCGIRSWRAIGENIAYNRGYKEPMEKAVELWMESTAHRLNLLDGQWRESAIGVAIASDGSYYFTQVFLRK
ncbi:MAG: CAP domain-containing protein [Acidobacteriota bacterium]